jgi:hypothetical protein
MLTLKPSLSGYLLSQFTSINVFKSSQLVEEIDNLTTGLMDKTELFIAPVPRRKDEKSKLGSACVALDPCWIQFWSRSALKGLKGIAPVCFYRTSTSTITGGNPRTT